MFSKIFPWKYFIRRIAKRHGFLDPLEVIARLQNFAQPAEVAAPLELIRAGAVFHARGLVNSQAIQHNLDWIWPYWVERQFDPHDDAFVPRAFSATHINLCERNWTAVGVPDCDELPIVDPRGLVTPFFDGWSIDAWVISDDGSLQLIPSKHDPVTQRLYVDDTVMVETVIEKDTARLQLRTEAICDGSGIVCKMEIEGTCGFKNGMLVISIRPYNPEGISFVHTIEEGHTKPGWTVNGKHTVLLSESPVKYLVSSYHEGDVFRSIFSQKQNTAPRIKCRVGMASAAAVFKIRPNETKRVTLSIPIHERKKQEVYVSATDMWKYGLAGASDLCVGDAQVQFLFDAAKKTLILHSPGDIYPGPYTYKRFWFRDAAFILNSMISLNLLARSRTVIDGFKERQTPLGYFLSQEGEWDSNGEALWIIERYCRLSGEKPADGWKKMIQRGADWILRKRVSDTTDKPHAGLFPAGFSAEHLGPNDYYFWDDFWGVAGMRAAHFLMTQYGDSKRAEKYLRAAEHFMDSVEASITYANERLDSKAIPASPYRRMDAGAVGSLVCAYPLRLYAAPDERVRATADFIMNNCIVDGGFFQDMTHSGINQYLTLHLAQVLLRASDPRFKELIYAVAGLASPTGQWPEAIHPRTKGGCMGDGQHVWAAAEWLMMVRNAFVREEDDRLIIASGVVEEWMDRTGKETSFGPTLTPWGPVTVRLLCSDNGIDVRLDTAWRGEAPEIEVRLPGYRSTRIPPGQDHSRFMREHRL